MNYEVFFPYLMYVLNKIYLDYEERASHFDLKNVLAHGIELSKLLIFSVLYHCDCGSNRVLTKGMIGTLAAKETKKNT
ncbi:hypothetical protein KS4_26340 [Poriferisphaera corsica]|uniref:Uncharacterized protein n=1 Tax=Poriferisphaera corsica TaxID=2528020 RepID=A0A517YWG8_9BACT|nr:hypothetical protein KS4_26340 [Poriferisphaera corsica]